MSNDPSPGIIALLVAGALVLILRWVWGSRRTSRGLLVDASDSRNLGLLSVVATQLDREHAMQIRAVLGGAGLRSSMSRRRDGTLDVLVFHADLDRARALLEV